MLNGKREHSKTEYFIKVQRGLSVIALNAETFDDPAPAVREAAKLVEGGEAYVEIHMRTSHVVEEMRGSFGKRTFPGVVESVLGNVIGDNGGAVNLAPRLQDGSGAVGLVEADELPPGYSFQPFNVEGEGRWHRMIRPGQNPAGAYRSREAAIQAAWADHKKRSKL